MLNTLRVTEDNAVFFLNEIYGQFSIVQKMAHQWQNVEKT